MSTDANNAELINHLNSALAWELRAETQYSHYAAYVKGIYRLHLKPYFEGEASESVLHGRSVREQIVRLGGQAITDRDSAEIVHTTDFRVMLKQAYATETHAAAAYKTILGLPGIDRDLSDTIEQIYFQELRSIEELNQLLDS